MSERSPGFVAAALLVLACVAPRPTPAAEVPEVGICEEQIAADLVARFGQKITRIDWTFEPYLVSETGLKSQALVYADGCPGYHVYDVFATDHDCLSRAHYGTLRTYVRYRVSEAGC